MFCLILALPQILHADVFEKNSFESVPLKYEVIAQGIPKPEAEWYHNGKLMQSDDRVSITVDGVSIIGYWKISSS